MKREARRVKAMIVPDISECLPEYLLSTRRPNGCHDGYETFSNLFRLSRYCIRVWIFHLAIVELFWFLVLLHGTRVCKVIKTKSMHKKGHVLCHISVTLAVISNRVIIHAGFLKG